VVGIGAVGIGAESVIVGVGCGATGVEGVETGGVGWTGIGSVELTAAGPTFDVGCGTTGWGCDAGGEACGLTAG
jgi:hypothetical protein